MGAERLTARQLDVLARYAWKGSVAGVALDLGLARSTVKNEIHNAYKRLEVKNAIEAFHELGWLTPPHLEDDDA